MKRFYYLLVGALLLSFVGNAQTAFDRTKFITYTGKIVDANSGEPLPFSQINHIYKIQGSDSLIIRNSVADREGKFTIQSPRVMDNRIEIVCLGYKILTRMLSEAGNKEKVSYGNVTTISASKKDNSKQPEIYNQFDLGVLKLAPDVQQIDEVMVKARINLFKQVGDTLLFFPKNLKQFEGETLEDILKRLPNFHVDEHGNIFVNGKQITRAKLNDKHIFGEDVRTAVTSIMAKEAGLIQVYDEVDETSEILNGTENAAKRRVMNVVTFKDFDIFKGGNIHLETGLYADKDVDGQQQTMHDVSGKIGQYTANFRISLEGNTKKTAFPQEHRQTGVAFSTQVSSDELERALGFDYSYGKDKQETESRTERFYFPTSYFDTQTAILNNRSVQDKNSHNFALNGRYIKKLEYSLQGGYSATIEDADMQSLYHSNMTKDGEQLSYLQQLRQTDNRNQKHTASLALTTSIKNVGSVQFDIRGSIDKKSDEGIREDSSCTAGMANKLILTTSGNNPEYRLSSFLSLRKRFGKISIGYTPQIRYNQSDQVYLAMDRLTGKIDSITSRDQLRKDLKISNGISTNFNITNDFGIALDFSYNNYKLQLNERLVPNSQVEKKFNTWTGQISIRLLGELLQFGVQDATFYTGYLSTRLIDNDPMNLRVGNPNLKMGHIYVFNTGYNFNNVLKLNVDYKFNTDPVIPLRRYFTTNTTLEEYGGYEALAGATLNTYINAKSHSELLLSLSGNSKRGAVLVSGRLGYRFDNPEADLLGETVRSYRHQPNASLSLMSNFSSTVRLDIKDYLSYSYTKVKAKEPQKHNWLSNNLSVNFNLNLFSRLMVNADYKYSYNRNSRTDQTVNLQSLNASVDYRIFSNRKGLISFNAYNLLNAKSSLSTTTQDLYIQNTYTPENSTLFTISFKYKFGVEQ